MKPTKIISKPVKVKDEKGNWKWHITCDNGVTYSGIKPLADAIGLHHTSMSGRLKKHGWDHPRILAPTIAERGKKKAEPIDEALLSEIDEHENIGPRINISSIPGPTAYELKHLS